MKIDESLRLVQNSGTNSDIRFLNPVTEKPPGCLWFAAIKKEMFCFARCHALAHQQNNQVQNEYHISCLCNPDLNHPP